MTAPRFPGRLALQQRVLTTYRAPFIDALAQACDGGLSVCAGRPRPDEAIATTDRFQFASFTPVQNHHLFQGAYYFCWQSGLPEWLDACSPDILIVEANPRYLSTPAAIRWMKRRGRPVLGWGLGSPPLSGPIAGIRGLFRQAFLQHFAALITYSQRGAQQYAGLGFPAGRIFVAPNATAGSPTQPVLMRPEGIIGKPNVLFVGRLQARKRVDLLLQACSELPGALQPNLVIVGDGPEREALERMAKKCYPPAYFPGAKHGAELAALFSAADLFVLPGTGGLAVQEAMSHGLPVIMGQGDGTNDDLVRPENGWQIPPGDLSSLKEAMQNALSDVVRLRRMGEVSYRIVRDEINLDRMVGIFLEALHLMK
jgi:glycosyltransferase involved in cell wall biosynthesis